MHKFFLIRHGESQSNAGLATTEPKAVELTSLGHQQATQIAAFLKEYTSLNLIVTSAYLRTKQTATPTKEIFHKSAEEWEVQEFTYLSSMHQEQSTTEDRKPLVELYSVHGINRTHKVALVTERHGGVDAHAAFETGIRCRPLFFARRHAFGRHESLAATAW